LSELTLDDRVGPVTLLKYNFISFIIYVVNIQSDAKVMKVSVNVALCAQLMVVSQDIWFKCKLNILVHYKLLEDTELETP
jgi:hypothetical protein